MHTRSVHFFHDFLSLAKGILHPSAKHLPPSGDCPGKIRAKNCVDGGCQRFEHAKHSVSQSRKEPDNRTDRIVKDISDKVCNLRNKVINQHKHIRDKIPQANQNIADKRKCNHKRTAD